MAVDSIILSFSGNLLRISNSIITSSTLINFQKSLFDTSIFCGIFFSMLYFTSSSTKFEK
ncbi:MAG TPA: hypothetical protein P5150_06405 [Candidatus Ratteibacteria bacterium]|nr:hypothetical protein [bacterium]HRR96344.1 hypothetical protein [Candidatus Ratteibacteria bacterium]